MAGGPSFDVTMPSDHAHVLGRANAATEADAAAAIEAAQAAAPDWAAMSFDDRAAIFLRAADLLAGPWRATLNAATMLGSGQDRPAGRDRRCLRADRLLAVQRHLRPGDPGQPADLRTGSVEPHRLPAARRVRLRDHPVQLHRDRREPAHRTRAAGQHRALEAEPRPSSSRPTSPCSCCRRPGCRPGVINLLPGDGVAVSEVGAGASRPGRDPLHRLDQRPSSTCGRPSGPTSRATAATRGWWGRPAARTSSSPTPAPTPTCCGPRWSAERSSTPARSARRPPGRTSPAVSGTGSRRPGRRDGGAGRWATFATWPTSPRR